MSPATVIVPTRSTPEFAAALKATWPLPVPDDPLVTVSQSTLFELALHPHDAVVVTVRVPALPAAPIVRLDGSMANAQGASCVTVNVWLPIVSAPVRCAPVFAATEKLTDPLPVPAAPEVTVSQSRFEAAVHPHVSPVEIVTVPPPPAAPTIWPAGEIESVHGTAAWEIVSAAPPTAIWPLRAPPVLADTLNCTVPPPVPDAPAEIVIQPTLGVAVHAQPCPAVTFAWPSPPAAATSIDVGEMVNEHGAAACVTVKVRAAIVAVPVRAMPTFAATLSLTDPGPVPLAPAATVIQAAFEAAVHAHPFAVVTSIVPVPPAAPTVWPVG